MGSHIVIGGGGGGGGGEVTWGSITGKPTSFPPSLHEHTMDQVLDLLATLGEKATPADIAAAMQAHLAATNPHPQYSMVGGEGPGEEITPVTATFVANGFTPVLPLNAHIRAIRYKVTGGTITNLSIKNEAGNLLGGLRDASGVIQPATLAAGSKGSFDGDDDLPYETTFGRLGFEAEDWGGASLEVAVYFGPGVDSVIYPQLPTTPATITPGDPTTDSVALSCDISTGASTYVWEKSPDGSTGWELVGNTAEPSILVEGLTENTTYYFRVHAENLVGPSGYSAVVSITTDELEEPAIDADAAAYVARSGATDVQTIDTLVRFFKNEEGNLSENLWTRMRSGILCQSALNATEGIENFDLTPNNRGVGLTDPVTRTATHLDVGVGGQIWRIDGLEPLLPLGSGSPFAMVCFLGAAESGNLDHIMTIGGGHNDPDNQRIYLREDSGGIREIGAYYWVMWYGDGGVEKSTSFCISNDGTGDTLYGEGDNGVWATNSMVRNFTSSELRMFSRGDDPALDKAGKLYAMFFFDGPLSGDDYATIHTRVKSILGIPVTP